MKKKKKVVSMKLRIKASKGCCKGRSVLETAPETAVELGVGQITMLKLWWGNDNRSEFQVLVTYPNWKPET